MNPVVPVFSFIVLVIVRVDVVGSRAGYSRYPFSPGGVSPSRVESGAAAGKAV